jgi:hypothetical protein
MFYPLSIFLGEQPSPALQLGVVLRVLLSLYSRPGWIVLFHLVLNKGEPRLHILADRVGLAHLPTLVLPMAGAQWTLRD